MRMTLHDAKFHDVELMDDGTLDTVVRVDGKHIGRFSPEYMNDHEYRTLDGFIEIKALRELAYETLWDAEHGGR